MSNKKCVMLLVLLMAALFLTSCSNSSSSTTMKMEFEITENYDDSNPFINEKVIYVSENMDKLILDVSFQMKDER